MSKWSFLKVLVLFCVVQVGLQAVANDAAKSNAPTVTEVVVAEVGKQVKYSYYDRLATSYTHIIATNQVPDGASWWRKVKIDSGERLVFLEVDPINAQRPVFAEIGRRGHIAIAVWPAWMSGDHGHDPNNARTYAYVVSLEMLRTSMPAIFDEVATVEKHVLRGPIEVDVGFLRENVRAISGDKTVILNGEEVRIRERSSREGRRLSREFLRKKFEEMGYIVSEHSYGNGVNLIAQRGAQFDEFVIVSAHYDSVGNAGADDNGTGIVSALAIAKAIRDLPLNMGVRFVAFDEEERGLLGSRAYAAMLASDDEIGGLKGVFNIEMTGYDGDQDGAVHIIDCNENQSSQLTDLILLAMKTIDSSLKKTPACTNRSDHASFWRYNRPAIVMSENFFGGDGNPCYHAQCDQVSRINFEYMKKVTTALGTAVATFVGD